MENANSKEYLNKILNSVVENIRKTGTPSVQLTQTPADPMHPTLTEDYEEELNDLDADENPDTRVTQRQRDQQTTHDADLYDSEAEDEEYKESLGVRRQPGQPRRRNIMEFQNPDAVPDEPMEDADTPDVVRGLNGETGRVTNPVSPAPGPARRSVSRASSAKPAAGATNGTSSRTRTPAAVVPEAADEDGDVEMGDVAEEEEEGEEGEGAAAEAGAEDQQQDENHTSGGTTAEASPAGVVTPPESPTPGTGAAGTAAAGSASASAAVSVASGPGPMNPPVERVDLNGGDSGMPDTDVEDMDVEGDTQEVDLEVEIMDVEEEDGKEEKEGGKEEEKVDGVDGEEKKEEGEAEAQRG